MKAGLLCEGMIRVMFALDDITLPALCDAVERIDILQRREVLPADVAAAFHLMRKVRNKAAHEGLKIPETKTLYFLQITHSLCGWFFQTYGDESYRQQNFVAPQDAEISGPSPSESKVEAGQENALADQAVSRAAQASAVPEDTAANAPPLPRANAVCLRLKPGISLTNSSEKWAGRRIPKTCAIPSAHARKSGGIWP